MFQLENGLRSVEEWMSSGRWLLYLSKWRMVFFKEKFTYEILYDAYLQFYMSCESICPNGCHLSDKFWVRHGDIIKFIRQMASIRTN